ncbi:hypothetical protein L249_1954 [Ophiocordyceps polyrhachis-furcata BCC 54312]|uniref:Methyltransferase type 11 domain-containing protein n=1 Tax=Ophiocordyceps polyrhachis-furcata BCC 54312 TaxID=1330021 RepID=A0A367LNI9_9HYPO|nr:hypothetical protein L249_1954 [Ophiocordyceps polyrhachis-furcata BCC 54312]
MVESKVSLGLDSKELAHFYDNNSSFHVEGGKLMLKMMGVSPGWTVYDIGCGTGLLASHVADLVRPKGRVVGLEPLQYRVDIAQSRAKDNLSFEVGDAQDLSRIPNDSVDGVYLNSVIHWVPDRMQAIREAHRVLKPGGRLGITTASADHPQPPGIIRTRVMSRERYRGYSGPVKDRPNPTEDELRDLMADAGFQEIEIMMHKSSVETRDEKAMVDFCEAYSFGNYLGHIPRDIQSDVRDEIELEFSKWRTEGGTVRMDNMLRIIAVAVKA